MVVIIYPQMMNRVCTCKPLMFRTWLFHWLLRQQNKYSKLIDLIRTAHLVNGAIAIRIDQVKEE
jgi:hypothetical protein